MPRSWGDIHEFYDSMLPSIPWLHGILKLVERIEDSPHASHLYAFTSMQDLCITQTPTSDPPYLRISARKDASLEFRFIDTYIAEQQWHRVVSPTEGFARLESFMSQLHWIGKVPSAAS